MPQIVIIIDELADLMMAAPGEVEDSICRLAQMALCGRDAPDYCDSASFLRRYHWRYQSQYPFPSGICRFLRHHLTILDMVGAEKLLGKGDMLFYPSGQSKLSRIQGAFVTDKVGTDRGLPAEKTSRPGYTQEMVKPIMAVAKTAGGPSEETDEFFEQAVDLILEKKRLLFPCSSVSSALVITVQQDSWMNWKDGEWLGRKKAASQEKSSLPEHSGRKCSLPQRKTHKRIWISYRLHIDKFR